METSKAENMTVRHIKQQAPQLAQVFDVPSFWITDWLLYVINKPLAFLITDESYQLTANELEQFNIGIAKMQQGMPLAYLTGSQEFWSLNFKVNEHTLIPRPDTEVLVEQTLSWIKANKSKLESSGQHKRLLDLGTGSGCIAISLAYELTNNKCYKQDSWQIVAVDLSQKALEVAQYNAVANKINNMEFLQSSWYEHLSNDDTKKFDVIVSNPPYIDETDEHLASLQAEPISALTAPNQGLADIEHILMQASQYLQVAGLLAIEHGHNQGQSVRQLFVKYGFDKVRTVQDFGENDRVTLGQLL
ncbi:MAG: peptide chain release factor N(5)-glutamine methyltransferase [Psychrobacter sp.]|nr:peptide chain release factor N(5)-glutamine methyltransferase [Psychrobacter sp.]